MPSKQVEDVYNAGGFDGGPLGRPGKRNPREDVIRMSLCVPGGLYIAHRKDKTYRGVADERGNVVMRPD